MTAHFFNLHNEDDGIRRSLADGVATRIFPGQQAKIDDHGIIVIRPEKLENKGYKILFKFGFFSSIIMLYYV